jgi:hypothetical protein
MISRVLTSGVPGLDSPFPAELGIFLTASILVVVALILASGRGTADPEHVAPVARYFGAIIVLTSFVALFAAFSMVFSLTDLIVDHTERSAELRREYNSEEGFIDDATSIVLPVSDTQFDFSAERNNDANYSAAVASGLVALTAAAIALFHLRARRRLHADSAVVQRVERAARLGVCFVTALTVAIAVTSVAFGIFEIIAPGLAIGGVADVGRAEGVSEALSFGFLAVLAGIGFRRSWRRVLPKPAAPETEAVTAPAG